ncbi:hypothetical protein ZWY2020_018530 [Hordeum vulgare]|nr:hypothetical protein ZWY2020_018530 [Hordeum vulgare]
MRVAATSTAISLLSPSRFRTSAPASLPYHPEAARSPVAVEPPAPPLSKFKVALCQLSVTADKARNIGGMAAMARRGVALALAMARRGMCSASAPAGERAAATLSSEELIRMEQDCSAHKYGIALLLDQHLLPPSSSHAFCLRKCLSAKFCCVDHFSDRMFFFGTSSSDSARGSAGRSFWRKRKVAMLFQRYKQAAIAIQCAWRQKLARRELRKLGMILVWKEER